jgi:hypothetical protein
MAPGCRGVRTVDAFNSSSVGVVSSPRTGRLHARAGRKHNPRIFHGSAAHVCVSADLAPTIAQIRAGGAETLTAIAAALNDAGIPTPRGQGKWSPAQVARTLEAMKGVAQAGVSDGVSGP